MSKSCKLLSGTLCKQHASVISGIRYKRKLAVTVFFALHIFLSDGQVMKMTIFGKRGHRYIDCRAFQINVIAMFSFTANTGNLLRIDDMNVPDRRRLRMTMFQIDDNNSSMLFESFQQVHSIYVCDIKNFKTVFTIKVIRSIFLYEISNFG